MARHKSFVVPQSTEEVFFDLEGEGFKERFRCRPQIAAGLLLTFGASSSGDSTAQKKRKKGKAATEADVSQGNKTIKALLGFFEGALAKGEYPRFMALINDPDKAIPMTTLEDTLEWLIDGYTDRPTGGRSSGTSASGKSGDDSTGVPSIEVPTYSRSPRTASAI